MLAPYLPVAVLLFALWSVGRPIEGVGDAFQFWLAGHLVATGGSAYDRAAWGEAAARYGPVAANVAVACADPSAASCDFVYPPPATWLLAPFGAAPPEVGLPLVEAFAIVLGLAGVAVAVRVFGPDAPGERGFVLATVVASHPFVYDVHVTHFLGLTLLGVAGAAVALRGGRTWPLVLGALALSLTPHLVLVLAPAVLVMLVVRRRWRAIATTAAALLAVLIVGAVLDPHAYPALLARAGGKLAFSWSTPWALATVLVPDARVVVFGALLAIAVAAGLVVVRAVPPRGRQTAVVAVAAALSLAIAPYAQPYDLLLLVPALALAARRADSSPTVTRVAVFAALPLSFVGLTWAAIVLERLVNGANSLVGVLPALSLLLAAAPSACRLATQAGPLTSAARPRGRMGA